MSFELLREHYLDQPKEVSLETFSKCNAACTFCPYPTLERIGTKLDDALMWRLVDEMSEWEKPFDFCPFKVNEPLLDKRLMPLLERIETDTKGHIRLFTNGQALTWKWLESLNQLDRLSVLWVSLNSHVKEVYEPLMSLSWDRVTKNLDALHESDFRHHVVLSKVGGPDIAFQAYCQQRWPLFEPVIIKRDSWLGFTDAHTDVVPDAPCSRWFELNIMANGVCSLCCMDGEGKYSIGDLNKQTMLEVYNAPQWRERREGLLSRKGIHPCSTCTY